jgi:hypothetical protein
MTFGGHTDIATIKANKRLIVLLVVRVPPQAAGSVPSKAGSERVSQSSGGMRTQTE